jgi:hypothetical protein
MMATVEPKAEPEVAFRQQHPVEGGLEWVQRYEATLVLMTTLKDLIPTSDPAVQFAMVQLCDAMAEDLKRHG